MIMANILILFGFAWMVVAALLGFLLARRHESASVALERLAAKGDFLEYHRAYTTYAWNKTVHAHAFLFSVVAVLVGLAFDRMHYPEAIGQGLVLAMITSAVVWTLGALRANRPLMVIGDLALLASVVTAAIGMAKAL